MHACASILDSIAKDLLVSTIFRIVMLLKLNSQVAQSPGRML